MQIAKAVDHCDNDRIKTIKYLNKLKGKVKTVAAKFKDGTWLCADFQKGQCKQKGRECPKGKHACGAVTKTGRVCGGPHCPAQCRNKAVV
ncbi:MAG: hypothetical protein ACPIOQ_61820, partial [Promethearchaeia archaeon]